MTLDPQLYQATYCAPLSEKRIVVNGTPGVEYYLKDTDVLIIRATEISGSEYPELDEADMTPELWKVIYDHTKNEIESKLKALYELNNHVFKPIEYGKVDVKKVHEDVNRPLCIM